MSWIEVENNGPLNGSVSVQGSKNSSLALLAATCLSSEPVILKGIPNILDVQVISEMAREIGMKISRDMTTGELFIDPRDISSSALDLQKTSAFRASYYFIGALLAKFQKVTLGYPGGDDFGSRPIDQHIKGLKALGATFTFHKHHYEVEASRLHGAEIYFDMITSGSTINLILAAALAKGKTVLRNAAKDPEVVDVSNLLNKMGARIVGAGTDTVRIEGVDQLGGCAYTVIPDRLIAGAFLMAAGATGGAITVDGTIPEHLGSCLAKLEEVGIHIEVKDHSVTAYGGSPLRATRVRTGMYPGFATDLQQPLTALLLQASGKSIITDKIYPKRFNHVQQLRRMGATIEVRGESAFISGNRGLIGEWVHASDVRAGTCMIIAGLMAEGTTKITGIEHIERGYEDAISLFRSLGAKISVSHHQETKQRGEDMCLQKNVKNGS